MKILFLSRWFPYPPDNGSKIRIFNILRQLSAAHDVSLVSFADDPASVEDAALSVLRRFCSSVQVVPYRPFRPSSARALAGLLSYAPRFLIDTYSTELQAAADARLARGSVDLLVASQLDMVPYAVAGPAVPALLEELELSLHRDAARAGGVASRPRRMLTWLKLRSYLRRVLPRFAACTVASERERLNLRAAVPTYRRAEVVPNAVDLGHYDGDFGSPRPNVLAFAGSLTYHANYDAIRSFLGAAYPAIAHSIPGVELRVTGSHAGVDLKALPDAPGVTFTGRVPDVRPVVAGAWASVVPLRVGGGTRLKILESMALGTPVVSTSKGAEGLDVTHGENILIADHPDDFAAQVVSLLRSPQLRARLAAGGRRLVASRYDWNAVGADLSALVHRVAAC
ncbi:MAG TPA: glycosyltransferase [Chloroflexota bacterium]|nr:glycosyltransferase [Chloroflexota bacterium]